MAQVPDILEMWHGSQNLCTTQKESRAQNWQMTAVRYISDTFEIVKPSWSLFHPEYVAASELSERSPLPPALSAMNRPGARTQLLNVRRIRRINGHPVDSYEVCPPESISDTDDWLNCNGDLDNPNNGEDDCAVDDQSDIEPNYGIEDTECPEQQDVSAALNVPGFVRPTQMSNRQAERVLVMVNAAETRRNKEGNKK
jgi:hypothetical protein